MKGTLNKLTTHPTPQRRTADPILLSGRRPLPAETATPTHDRRLMMVLEAINEKRLAKIFVRHLGLKKAAGDIARMDTA